MDNDGRSIEYEIEIADSQNHLKIDEAFLREVVRKTLAAENVVAAQISIAIVDNAAIRILNKRYLSHDYDTDVLSFLLENETPTADSSSPVPTGRGGGKRIEGELIVSAEMAAARAAEFDWRSQDEIVLYVVHGLLHLAGYDDLSAGEKRLMRAQEREVLQFWDLTPRYDDSDDDQPRPDLSPRPQREARIGS